MQEAPACVRKDGRIALARLNGLPQGCRRLAVQERPPHRYAPGRARMGAANLAAVQERGMERQFQAPKRAVLLREQRPDGGGAGNLLHVAEKQDVVGAGVRRSSQDRGVLPVQAGLGGCPLFRGTRDDMANLCRKGGKTGSSRVPVRGGSLTLDPRLALDQDETVDHVPKFPETNLERFGLAFIDKAVKDAGHRRSHPS